jgi:hypothetical protein
VGSCHQLHGFSLATLVQESTHRKAHKGKHTHAKGVGPHKLSLLKQLQQSEHTYIWCNCLLVVTRSALYVTHICELQGLIWRGTVSVH